MKYVALKEVSNEVLINGDGCITTLEDLYTLLIDPDTTEIEIRKDFINEFFTYDALCQFVEQSASLAPSVRVFVPDVFTDSTLDTAAELKQFRKVDEFIYALEFNPTKYLSTIHKLVDSYLEAHEEATVANNKIATMLVQIDDLQKNLLAKEMECKSLQTTLNDTMSKLQALVSRVNFKYDKTINTDEMFLASQNGYKHVLYIKEITRVHYVDSLLYYLGEILKTLYSVPVRSVVIESYYSYGKEYMYDKHTPHWKLTYRDVYSGDILMSGYQPKLMTDILKNSNHVHYLIILDRGGYHVPHVSGGNVSTVYTASDVKDVPKNVSMKDVITYEEATLNIPYIEGFDEMSPEIKIQKYSSMPIMKGLISMLEEVVD